MPVTLIAASDIHLGRRPTRLPDAVSDRLGALTPAEAWRALVREAVGRRVDAVLLAGDVVDSEDDRFGALAVLEPALEELLGHGIDVVTVAGNHDVHALPRLAELLGADDARRPPGSGGGDGRGRFVLLGAGGKWEEFTVRGRDGSELLVTGRSFRSPRERESPLAGLPAGRPGGDIARIGLLHCDVDGGPSSHYAPVALRELEAADLDAWLLGHVHVPGPMTDGRPIGYLGSLTGLDPGEPGERGAWIFRVAGRGRIEAERLRIAPLVWETVRIDAALLDGDAEGSDDEAVSAALDRLVHRALSRTLERLAPVLGAARAVGCRIRLVGRTPHDRAVRRLCGAASDLRDATRTAGGVTAFIESIEAPVLPAVDLDDLALTPDPPGLLARTLVRLRDGDAQAAEMVAAATRQAVESAGGAPWNEDGPLPDEETMRDLLLDAGYDALGALLAQTAPPRPAR